MFLIIPKLVRGSGTVTLKVCTPFLWVKQTAALLSSTNSKLQWNVLTLVFCLFTVGVQQVNTSETMWIKMGYAIGGIFRGKVMSDLHLLFWEKKEPPGVALLYLEIAWDHFLITKVADIVNFINERVVLEGSLTHVEAGSNTSTVTLRVVRGDEMGLKKAAP
jgi:hypothetical protein